MDSKLIEALKLAIEVLRAKGEFGIAAYLSTFIKG